MEMPCPKTNGSHIQLSQKLSKKHFSECLQVVDYNTSDRDLVPYCPSVFLNCFVFSTWQSCVSWILIAFFSINFILNCICPILSYFQFGKLCSYTIYRRASYFLFSAVFLPAEDFQLGKCISFRIWLITCISPWWGFST